MFSLKYLFFKEMYRQTHHLLCILCLYNLFRMISLLYIHIEYKIKKLFDSIYALLHKN